VGKSPKSSPYPERSRVVAGPSAEPRESQIPWCPHLLSPCPQCQGWKEDTAKAQSTGLTATLTLGKALTGRANPGEWEEEDGNLTPATHIHQQTTRAYTCHMLPELHVHTYTYVPHSTLTHQHTSPHTHAHYVTHNMHHTHSTGLPHCPQPTGGPQPSQQP
jgi:hypothetical protein